MRASASERTDSLIEDLPLKVSSVQPLDSERERIENISAQTDGEEQEITSTHSSTGPSSHGTNGRAGTGEGLITQSGWGRWVFNGRRRRREGGEGKGKGVRRRCSPSFGRWSSPLLFDVDASISGRVDVVRCSPLAVSASPPYSIAGRRCSSPVAAAPRRSPLLPIGFAVFLVYLAIISITGTGINPTKSLGAAIIFNRDHAWNDHWIFWVGPFIGATLAAVYHQTDNL
ncbi:hypothetical protein Ahy_B07g087705 [Arachis hypogaea]|uniref:Aquaporin n=1 Tax=Arachis hypogaea TaxID=3818 RepID=A0A444YCT1_ARAHY|nr:hypothetical protein Ahy_B07g087705 [Arachis hypogaea]